MQKGLLFFLLFITSLSKAQDLDVLHYDFTLDLREHTDTISGLAKITLVHQTTDTFVRLDLVGPTAAGKGMRIETAGIATKPFQKLRFTQTNEQVVLQTPMLRKGDTAEIHLLYAGIPDDGLIISKNKFGDRTFFADNWPNRAHHWIPCNDRPDDKATVTFRVGSPQEYSVISNGKKFGEGPAQTAYKQTIWEETTPIPTKVMVIGAARFAVKTFDKSPKNTPVSAWVYPQDSTKGFYDYALATGIVKFFSDYIAPFPFNKLANVQSTTIFGGMENASCIFYDEKTVTGDRSSEDLLAHEIAHQWFGDMASEKSFAHLWLSEGFATYMTDLYFEKKYGKEAAAKRLQKEREEVIDFARASKSAIVDSTSNLMSLLNANSYQKGSWVLHMLRTEVGDSAFHQIIKTYYNTYKGGNAETRDFEAVAEKVSGKDLKWFFDQWLYRPGISRIKVKWKQENSKILISIMRSGAVNQRLPLEILTEYADRTTAKHRIELRSGTTNLQFSYTETNKATEVILDPDMKLLMESSITNEK